MARYKTKTKEERIAEAESKQNAKKEKNADRKALVKRV
jgi:hypothetical protein